MRLGVDGKNHFWQPHFADEVNPLNVGRFGNFRVFTYYECVIKTLPLPLPLADCGCPLSIHSGHSNGQPRISGLGR
jgi:hypothetical protein